ncbi:MAG TPA: acetylxylan esterase [Gemmataceae bacterium]|nr:acetylxylan esterase [Gemmataceae bacterium]
MPETRAHPPAVFLGPSANFAGPAGRRGLACLAAYVLAFTGPLGPAWAGEAKPAVPYAVAHDAPLKATEKLVKDADDLKQFRVEFNGIKGDRVPAFLYVPKKGKPRRPAVLLQYGSGGNKSTGYITTLGHQFAARGFVVLTIDAPGRGERAPKQKKRFAWLDFDHERQVFVQYLGDDSRAVDYLMSRPDVDPRRLAFVGISWGAITGIPFVAHDPRVKAMASMVGGGDVLSVLPPKMPDKVRQAIKPLDPVNTVSLIAPRPLLLLNVTRDQLIPRACAEALHKAAGKGAKVVWLDTDHYFHGQDRGKIADSVIDFLLEHLPAR